ncbi:unnamed protein product [Ceratitis capitata]|uniref:(Mediterranean fruit fly) hypothetical protein n=1 Tax=Ceratitis capitata TaxID=7213 RepID=A0A811UFB0_CERCA|nr:unnamed protein product [Ceratitis capitata]
MKAFLVIFPGVRKQKFTTFSTVTLSLFVGLVILITRLGSAWHVAHTTIIAPYKAFSREKMPSRIGTHIGLMHVNVTLTASSAALQFSFMALNPSDPNEE